MAGAEREGGGWAAWLGERARVEAVLEDGPAPSLEALEAAFLEAVAACLGKEEKAAVLFSGGVDSCALAQALARCGARVTLYACGVEGSPVLARAPAAARALGFSLRVEALDEEAMARAGRAAGEAMARKDPVQLAIGAVQYAALRAAGRDGWARVFAGQGADELFGGYDAFRAAAAKGPAAVKALVREKLLGMQEQNLAREQALAARTGVAMEAPCLWPGFVRVAWRVPAWQRVRGENDFVRKHAWRALAVRLGVPEALAMERKKAMQYDAGAVRALRRAKAKKP